MGKTAEIPEPPPTPGRVVQDMLGAMLALDPVKPLGIATARDADGRELYLVAVVLGDENIRRVRSALEEMRSTLDAPTM